MGFRTNNQQDQIVVLYDDNGNPISGSNAIPVAVVSGSFSGSFTFPDVQTITGSVKIDEQPVEITGSVGFSEVATVTGSLALSQVATVTGSVGISEIVTVDITNQPVSITGSVSLDEQPIEITGSVRAFSDPNDPMHVTGSVVIGEQPIETTGSVRVFSDPNDPTHVTGSLALSQAVPVGDNVIGFVKITDSSGSLPDRAVDLVYDVAEQVYRLAVTAKVTISSPEAPPNTTEVVISADDPLEVSISDDTTYTITSGSVLHIQQLVAGAAGDPNEKGSKVEVLYSSSIGEHLVERVYVIGETQFGSYPDTSTARDGTPLSGSGASELIIFRRSKLGGTAREIDAVLRGFER
jgi:lipopolysaccharide export system protein LptA